MIYRYKTMYLKFPKYIPTLSYEALRWSKGVKIHGVSAVYDGHAGGQVVALGEGDEHGQEYYHGEVLYYTELEKMRFGPGITSQPPALPSLLFLTWDQHQS